MRDVAWKSVDVTKYQKKAVPSRQKKFGIEYHYKRMNGWSVKGWYATEKQRDDALATLVKCEPGWIKLKSAIHYRAVNR